MIKPSEFSNFFETTLCLRYGAIFIRLFRFMSERVGRDVDPYGYTGHGETTWTKNIVFEH